MAKQTITGSGAIASADYKAVKWVGQSKTGKAVTISLQNAINMSDINWSMKEKDDIVQTCTFTATYDNTNAQATSTDEPWSIEVDGGAATGAASVVLGVGVFYIGDTAVALCRGGGEFAVRREFREINADGDRGPVKDRIVIESSRAELTMNVLSVLDSVANLYAGISVATA